MLPSPSLVVMVLITPHGDLKLVHEALGDHCAPPARTHYPSWGFETRLRKECLTLATGRYSLPLMGI